MLGGYPVDFAGTWELNEGNIIEILFDDGDRIRTSGVRTGKTLGFWVGDRERPDPTDEYVHD